MKQISQLITDFIQKSIEMGDLAPVDSYYIQNKLLTLLQLKEVKRLEPTENLEESRLDLLDQYTAYAVKQGLIEDLSSAKDVFESQIMDVVTPAPSQVNSTFWSSYKESPKKATDEFYEMSKRNNYIKTREIAQNIEMAHETDFGQLQMTINLSKPEKSSQEIARAKENKSNYPLNALSIENEGYLGHVGHPGRSNHRVIRMNLKEDQWGFQFSPYSYYNEHSIFLSIEHREMHVDLKAIRNILEIITQFPHYFVGSNAGLPIVVGSILGQDHYQGGRHSFPLDEAEIIHEFKLDGLPELKAGIVPWPMSTIRLQSRNKEEVVKAAEVVINSWENYSDESVDLLSETNGNPHNAFTPIARRDGKDYVLDIVLRNNRTSERFPDGIFHPHPDVQHIKKENIGLIEVLGRAILPPRLKEELKEVKQYILGEEDTVNEVHQEWAEQLRAKYQDEKPDSVDVFVEEELGQVFLQVLKDAGVFKTDNQGKEAFLSFIKQIR